MIILAWQFGAHTLYHVRNTYLVMTSLFLDDISKNMSKNSFYRKCHDVHLARTLRLPDYAPTLCGRPNACFDVTNNTNCLKLGNNVGDLRWEFKLTSTNIRLTTSKHKRFLVVPLFITAGLDKLLHIFYRPGYLTNMTR